MQAEQEIYRYKVLQKEVFLFYSKMQASPFYIPSLKVVSLTLGAHSRIDYQLIASKKSFKLRSTMVLIRIFCEIPLSVVRAFLL